MASNLFKQTHGKPTPRLFAHSLGDQDGLLAFAQERCRQTLRWPQEPTSNTGFKVNTANSVITFDLNTQEESLHASWWMKSLWDPDGIYLSEDDLYNKTDIVGWLSMVKTDMINAGVKRLIDLFQGHNVFPAGHKAAVRAFTESARVFSDFMIESKEVVGSMHKALAPVYRPLWKVKGDDWVLLLDGTLNGAMVARIDNNRTKWRVKVPFQDHIIDYRGHFDIPPGNPTALDSLRQDLPDILLRILIEKVIVHHLADKVPAIALPTEWVQRNQIADGWTT